MNDHEFGRFWANKSDSILYMKSGANTFHMYGQVRAQAMTDNAFQGLNARGNEIFEVEMAGMGGAHDQSGDFRLWDDYPDEPAGKQRIEEVRSRRSCVDASAPYAGIRCGMIRR